MVPKPSGENGASLAFGVWRSRVGKATTHSNIHMYIWYFLHDKKYLKNSTVVAKCRQWNACGEDMTRDICEWPWHFGYVEKRRSGRQNVATQAMSMLAKTQMGPCMEEYHHSLTHTRTLTGSRIRNIWRAFQKQEHFFAQLSMLDVGMSFMQ